MLNDTEKDTLQILINNEILLETLRKIFDKAIEANVPEIMPNDNNELLGERYRAYELSKNIIKTGFTVLNSYRQGQKVGKSLNRAR